MDLGKFKDFLKRLEYKHIGFIIGFILGILMIIPETLNVINSISMYFMIFIIVGWWINFLLSAVISKITGIEIELLARVLSPICYAIWFFIVGAIIDHFKHNEMHKKHPILTIILIFIALISSVIIFMWMVIAG